MVNGVLNNLYLSAKAGASINDKLISFFNLNKLTIKKAGFSQTDKIDAMLEKYRTYNPNKGSLEGCVT